MGSLSVSIEAVKDLFGGTFGRAQGICLEINFGSARISGALSLSGVGFRGTVFFVGGTAAADLALVIRDEAAICFVRADALVAVFGLLAICALFDEVSNSEARRVTRDA